MDAKAPSITSSIPWRPMDAGVAPRAFIHQPMRQKQFDLENRHRQADAPRQLLERCLPVALHLYCDEFCRFKLVFIIFTANKIKDLEQDMYNIIQNNS